jgi:hypothetical protein
VLVTTHRPGPRAHAAHVRDEPRRARAERRRARHDGAMILPARPFFFGRLASRRYHDVVAATARRFSFMDDGGSERT